jgi:hypothetical protein
VMGTAVFMVGACNSETVFGVGGRYSRTTLRL